MTGADRKEEFPPVEVYIVLPWKDPEGCFTEGCFTWVSPVMLVSSGSDISLDS